MSKLITTSLIGSIDWYKKAPRSIIENTTQTWKEKAYNDLENMLARKWTTPGKAAQRGMDFENRIYNILNVYAQTIDATEIEINNLICSEKFKEVLRRCEGGKFQQKNKNYITVDGIEYCLYGKEDVTFPKLIIDIKTTMKYKESKYKDSFQHKIYLHNTGKKQFTYIIVIFHNEDSNTIQEIKYVDIVVDDAKLAEYKIEIINKIKEIKIFFDNMPELKKLYGTKYSKY